MARGRHGKALVLGHEMRSTLAVIRSLGRRGVDVILGTDRSQKALCRFSRYVNKTVYFPAPRYGIGRFIEGFLGHLESNRYDIIIPTTDIFMIPLVKFREEIEKRTPLAAPKNKAFQAGYDKFRTVEIASLLGIPVPETRKIETFSSFSGCLHGCSSPIVIKPRYTQVLVDDEIHHYGVRIATQEQKCREIVEDYLYATQILLQDFFLGTGMGVEVLCFKGEVLAAFQHERIHEPLKGGGSSYRKSVPLNPVLFDPTMRLMMHLEWTGVAMVEFLLNKDSDDFVLVEINGRFWGSLPLAIRAGVDFPMYLYQMLVKGNTSFPGGYRKPVYCRNITNDFWWLYGNVKSPHNEPYLKTLPLFSVLEEVKNIITAKEGTDTFTLDDPCPGLKDLEEFFRDLFERVRDRLRARLYRFLEKRGLFDWWVGRNKCVSSLRSTRSVLFICKGNVCRSPFAASYLQRKSETKTSSAGFIPRVHRPVPEIALRLAESFGVDLSVHRSRIINKAMFDEADVILVMDMDNYLGIINTFPGIKKKVLFLSWFGNNKVHLSIPDPLGQSPEFFKEVYKDIAECIDRFADFLESRSS